MERRAPLVVALVEVGAVGVGIGGAWVEVRVRGARGGPGEQGAEEFRVAGVRGVVESTVGGGIDVGGKEIERERERKGVREKSG